MSNTPSSQNDSPETPTPRQAEIDAPSPDETVVPEPVQDDSTVGMGTTMALGCVAGTIVLILFGLLYLLINAII